MSADEVTEGERRLADETGYQRLAPMKASRIQGADQMAFTRAGRQKVWRDSKVSTILR